MICRYFPPILWVSLTVFTLWIVSFDAKNILHFDWVQFIYFFFCCFAFGVMLKKSLPATRSWRFSPIFYPNGCIVLKFRSLLHFLELIFIYGIGKGVTSLFCIRIQIFQCHLLITNFVSSDRLSVPFPFLPHLTMGTENLQAVSSPSCYLTGEDQPWFLH